MKHVINKEPDRGINRALLEKENWKIYNAICTGCYMLAIAMAVGSTAAVAISQDSGTPHKLDFAARSGRRFRVMPGSITLREKRHEDEVEVEQLADTPELSARRELTYENIVARQDVASDDLSNTISLAQSIRGRDEIPTTTTPKTGNWIKSFLEYFRPLGHVGRPAKREFEGVKSADSGDEAFYEGGLSKVPA
ncbi:hypothetical protein BC835DRAFT_1528908 [Cytidiella melzeri]|nr:hypothetical protein BC835DRAFT_1528908 [Cytidiella melzeri]